MTIIDLFNNYWSVNRTDPMPPMCATLYFYLLHECNIRRWINPFELRTRQIELEIGLSRDTINDSRNALKQRGLIDFQNGKGKAPARYRIVGVKTSSKPSVVGVADNKTDNKEVSCRLNRQQNRQQISELSTTPTTKPTTKPTTNLQQTYNKPTTRQNTHIIIEDIKTKDIRHIPPNPQRGKRARGSNDGILDFGDEPKKKPPRINDPPPPTPTLEDVKVYFLSQCADKRLDDWETEAEIFYNNFTATDWVDANGRHIKRWDSRANRWILEKEQKQKQSQTNGTQRKANIQADRRGTDADGKAEKNWNETF